ncbi:MAG: hypothetical protein WBE80_03595 [Methylocella sp.]
MKQRAKAGDMVLLFADESEAPGHPHLARALARRGADPRIEAPGQSQKIAMTGAVDFVSRELLVETSLDLARHLVVLRPGSTTASPSSRGLSARLPRRWHRPAGAV